MAKTQMPRSARKPAPGAGPDPYVPDSANLPEFTWTAVLLGVVLGIVFGASSLYLVLKVGITVSASIPIAVLSITLFRALSRAFGLRRATILENNIVQTTGSAGESIAFGVGVTMPALLMLGHDMDLVRVMTVGVLGGLLGILMMIPLRRAFIVRQHGRLTYPEGTACADVLIVGEEGGATATTVFAGFGLAFVFKIAASILHLWQEAPTRKLVTATGKGLPGAEFGGELMPELLGVGYIIGPRVASIMVAGGILSALVLTPMIAIFAANQGAPIDPVRDQLVREMSAGQIRLHYILYIGAGAVTAGGIVSMLKALPLIVSSIRSGLGDMAAARGAGDASKATIPRSQRDLPIWVTLAGSMALVLAMAAVPNLGLGLNWHGLLGAVLIVLFGFLFVTVSARLTGEIGSSSNPISGMTVATLLFTCLIFVLFDKTDKGATLAALSIAAIVCIASSNGGTTAQDLKTGYLIGATPVNQQVAIVIGGITSAVVIGFTLLALNSAGTVYTRRAEFLPRNIVPDVAQLMQMERPGGQYASTDTQPYHVLHLGARDMPGVRAGKYLIDDRGRFCYYVDPAINGIVATRDDGTPVSGKFAAPKTHLMALIIDGILNGELPWGLVIIGVLIAVTLELAGVPSLPFAVGVYLPIQASVPIFAGGALRWLVERMSRDSQADSESSPGVLLSSGYIAGGTIAGVMGSLLALVPDQPKMLKEWVDNLDLRTHFSEGWNASVWPAITAFAGLALFLLLVGFGKLLGSAPEPAPEKPA
jgi:putative OPT family oligopeptide transporter